MPQIVEDRVDQVLRLSAVSKKKQQHLVRCLLAPSNAFSGRMVGRIDAELSKMASTTSFVPLSNESLLVIVLVLPV